MGVAAVEAVDDAFAILLAVLNRAGVKLALELVLVRCWCLVQHVGGCWYSAGRCWCGIGVEVVQC